MASTVQATVALVEKDQLDVGVSVLTRFFSASPGAAPFYNFTHPEVLENDPYVQCAGGNLVLAVGQVASGDKSAGDAVHKVEFFNNIANKPQTEEFTQTLSRCMLEALEAKLGADAFSGDVKEAWEGAFDSVAEAAIAAAPKESFALHKPGGIKRGPSMLKNRNSFRVMPPPANLFEHAAGPIEKSWDLVKSDIDALGIEVVHKWLTGAPDARALFHFAAGDDFRSHPDCRTHGRNILNAVGAIVAGLRDFESLGPTMEHLGVSHARHAVLAEQFPPLGRAIMAVIQERLGDAWTAEVANAWESVYAAISVRITSAMEAARAVVSSPKAAPPPEDDADEGDDVPVMQFGNLRAVDGRSPRTSSHSTHNNPFSPGLQKLAEEA